MKRKECRHCKHWGDPHWEKPEMHKCLVLNGYDGGRGIYVDVWCYETNIATAPDFGCKAFEAKEDE